MSLTSKSEHGANPLHTHGVAVDERHGALNLWAARSLGRDQPLSSEPLGGDASFRRYFRHRRENGGTWLLVDAPPETEDTRAFLLAGSEFRAAQLPVPHVLTCDPELGFLMLEDFGDRTYLPALLKAQSTADQATADALYGQAMQALLELQQSPLPSALPDYDRDLLERELRLFDEWFCERMLTRPLSAQERSLLDQTWEFLIDAAVQQPQVRVHRDYHSRNLMIRQTSDGQPLPHELPGIIDFQDAVIGPVTYDLVSLLRDCYIVWPDADVERWQQHFHSQAQRLGILTPCHDLARFRREFDLMGLQRHIKVLGIFSRLYLRDGKQRYLADVPVVMQYVVKVAALHPEMKAFLDWFSAGPMPLMQQRLQELGVTGSGAAP